MKTARIENTEFIRANRAFENGKIYFGTYIFFKRALLKLIDFIAPVLVSEWSSHIVCPRIKYMGKFSIERLNRFENTKEITIIIKMGFNKLHAYPKTDRLYFFDRSLFTSCINNGEYFRKLFIRLYSLMSSSQI